MEHINKIEIQGLVGNTNILKVGEGRVAHFSVATELIYKARNGEPVIETTWHRVTAWEGKGIQNLEQISKGALVNVKGRIRSQKYNSADGSEKTSTEIIAGNVTVMEKNWAGQNAE